MKKSTAQNNRSAQQMYNVRDYGAAADGKCNDTAAIQQAIDACHRQGGGTVVLGVGSYLAGTIVLKSRVAMRLSTGARLLASGNRDHYSMKHLIYAGNAEDVAIEGAGIIDGQSDLFYDPCPESESGVRRREWTPTPLIDLVDCRNVRIETIAINQAPRWTLRPKNCENVRIRGIAIDNGLMVPNSDGIDVDSSRNVIISDCHIEAGDDCIVLKTTLLNGTAKPTENVVVTNCILVSSASALKLGTESHADFRHCIFSNCVIRDSRTGIALLAKDGGCMESIHFNNITMTTSPKFGRGIEWPIAIDSEKRHDDSKLSAIRDVSIGDVTITTRGRIIVQGQAGADIESLVMRNVRLRVTGYEDIKGAKKVVGGTRTCRDVLDLGDKSAALIFAHVKDLVIDGVSVIWPTTTDRAEERHALYAQDLQSPDFSGLRAVSSSPDLPAMNTQRIDNC